MKKLPNCLILAVVSFCIFAQGEIRDSQSRGFNFGEFTLSHTGILSLVGKPARYMIVPEDRYPAQLRGLAVVDLRHSVYVARFFEPAGTGVEGFYDVCFQFKNGDIFSRTIDNAAGLERIHSKVFPRSSSYLFDSENRSLLKLESGNTNFSNILMLVHIKQMP